MGTAALLACSACLNQRTPVNQPSIEQVLSAHRDSLMAVPGVVGIAIGRRQGAPCILVMVTQRTAELDRLLPRELEGYPVEVQETGPIRAR